MKTDLLRILDELPENFPIYKDSGLWQIRTDDMADVVYQQTANESTLDFFARVDRIRPRPTFDFYESVFSEKP